MGPLPLYPPQPNSHGSVNSKIIRGNAPRNSKSKVAHRFSFELCVCIPALLRYGMGCVSHRLKIVQAKTLFLYKKFPDNVARTLSVYQNVESASTVENYS